MGWLPSIFGSDTPADSVKIDPKLREFLDKEAPVKYTPNQSSPSPSPEQQHGAPSSIASQSPAAPGEHAAPAVPAESLYQDGRYAHIWKSYKPLAQIESENASEHDKVVDVLEGYKERKNTIQKAALENCAMQQEEWTNCMKNGSWEDQLQMCRHQVRRFERCYLMQAVSLQPSRISGSSSY